ncbi:hypothetical protein A4A49_33894 [Nicotiana attenuata]|uniref:Uncharacterized protein n=1 Tax=Nicotiana attenuata TaxID=49451 RepID=A0A1J6KDS3_NICAT|nr:hypothetical protein A4A49_33894 [Nicotiana attenuata]
MTILAINVVQILAKIKTRCVDKGHKSNFKKLHYIKILFRVLPQNSLALCELLLAVVAFNSFFRFSKNGICNQACDCGESHGSYWIQRTGDSGESQVS